MGDGVCAVPLHGHRPPQRNVQLDHDVQDHVRLLPALRPVSPGELSVIVIDYGLRRKEDQQKPETIVSNYLVT